MTSSTRNSRSRFKTRPEPSERQPHSHQSPLPHQPSAALQPPFARTSAKNFPYNFAGPVPSPGPSTPQTPVVLPEHHQPPQYSRESSTNPTMLWRLERIVSSGSRPLDAVPSSAASREMFRSPHVARTSGYRRKWTRGFPAGGLPGQLAERHAA